MPAAGLEPARGCPQQILSLPRLPFRHAGIYSVPSNRTNESLSYFLIDCKFIFPGLSYFSKYQSSQMLQNNPSVSLHDG